MANPLKNITNHGFRRYTVATSPEAAMVPDGYILLKSKNRFQFTHTIIIQKTLLIGKSVYMDALINLVEKHVNSYVMLYDVDLNFLHCFVTCPSKNINDWETFEKAMIIGWRYHFEALLNLAVEFIENTPIPKKIQQNPSRIRQIMLCLRYRVPAIYQTKCLDILLRHPMSFYERPGAFIAQAFALLKEGHFQHVLLDYDAEKNYEKIGNDVEQTCSEIKKCCDFPEHVHNNRSKVSKYCESCQTIVCIKCRRRRCEAKLLAYIQFTFYIRTTKTKCRKSKLTRDDYVACGNIFPHDTFDTLEDCCLFE